MRYFTFFSTNTMVNCIFFLAAFRKSFVVVERLFYSAKLCVLLCENLREKIIKQLKCLTYKVFWEYSDNSIVFQ
jgi:hypothetical protein